MHYARILAAFAGEIWAMQPEKLEAVTAFLLFKARGGTFTPEEVEAKISDSRATATAKSAGGVAVLPIYGVISQRLGLMQNISGGTGTDALAEQFRAALADDAVKAIVFDVDSPGGSTYGVDELAAEIRDARGVKPIVAQVNSLCASAAYYLAAQADEVVVTPGGDAGSIGVYAVHEDVSKMLEQEGINPTLIRGQNGIYKAETNPYAPLGADAKDYLQARVDGAEDAFIKAVAAGRKVPLATVRDGFGKGRMFGAQDLVKRGMADRIDTMQATMTRFGAQSPRVGAAANSRRAFAAGAAPTLAQIEEVLREAGFPKALATDFVSLGKGALRSESGPQETGLSAEAKASLQQFMAKISA